MSDVRTFHLGALADTASPVLLHVTKCFYHTYLLVKEAACATNFSADHNVTGNCC